MYYNLRRGLWEIIKDTSGSWNEPDLDRFWMDACNKFEEH